MSADRLTPAQRQWQQQRASEVPLRQTKPWDTKRRMDRLMWGIEDTDGRITRLVNELRGELADIRDDIDAARHYHDHRLDEIWILLIRGGLLPPEALHDTVRDLTDRWGRVEDCPHCAESLAHEPFIPWPEPPQLTAEQREAIRDFVYGDEDEG